MLGDPTDLMGISSNGGFNAMSRHYLQLIEDSEIINLASSQEGTDNTFIYIRFKGILEPECVPVVVVQWVSQDDFLFHILL